MAQPLLAAGIVRFVGEPVAVVLTEERYQGEDAAELVDVDYDPLPAVVDPRDAATRRGAAVPRGRHERRASPRAAGRRRGHLRRLRGRRQPARSSTSGSPPRRWRCAPPPRSGATDGRLTAWMPQPGRAGHAGRAAPACSASRRAGPRHHARRRRRRSARSSAPTPSTRVVALAGPARSAGRSRWVETRSENMVGDDPRPGAGADRDDRRHTATARIAAYRLEVAAGLRRLPAVRRAAADADPADGARRLRHPQRARRSFVSVVTNTTPVGAYRGAGRPEATAAIERAIDLFAAEIGMDPAEVRRRNLLPAFTEPHTDKGGALYDCGDYDAALDTVLDAADYDGLRAEQAAPARARRRRAARHRAVGLRRDHRRRRRGGRAERERDRRGAPRRHRRRSSPAPRRTGRATPTVWAMLASEELGIPIDRITVQLGRHRPGPGGRRHRRLAQPAAGRRRRAAGRPRAGRAWPSERAADGSRSTRPTSSSTPTRRARGARRARARRHASPTLAAERAAAGAHGVHRARRRRTRSARTSPSSRSTSRPGKAELPRLIALDDAGTVINPLIAEGQRHGGLAQGAAQALLEEVLYDDDGNPTDDHARRLPDRVGHRGAELRAGRRWRRRRRTTRWAPRESARPGTIGATPAVQNAVVDAVAHLGVRHIDMPTTPDAGLARDQRGTERTQLMQVADHGQRRERVPTTSSRGCCSCTTCATCAGCKATNIGCDTTSCGACTVHARRRGGEVVHRARGRRPTASTVTTLEGLRRRRRRAAPGAGGVPRRARAAVRLLHAGHGDGGGRAAAPRTRDPTETEVREGLEGNLCRCTGYHNIVRAVLAAAASRRSAQ